MNLSTLNKTNIIAIFVIIVVVAIGGWAIAAISNQVSDLNVSDFSENENKSEGGVTPTAQSVAKNNDTLRDMPPQESSAADTSASSSTRQSAGPWQTRCSEEHEHCEIVQRLNVRESGQRFAEFAIGYPPGRDIARGVLILPLGILLEEGIKIQVDDRASFRAAIRYCAPQGCMAFMDISNDLLKQMKAGNRAMITFQNAGGRTLKLPITLEGFTNAITQLQKK